MSAVEELVKQVKSCSTSLAGSEISKRDGFLKVLVENLKKRSDEIESMNNIDLQNASDSKTDSQLLKRLVLNSSKIKTLIDGLHSLLDLPDPLFKTTMARELDRGLNLYKSTCPIGVICIIFESRPEAVIQICSLAIKSGNCVVLKGGKEAEKTNEILFDVIHQSLQDKRVNLPKDLVALVKSREEINQILKLDDLIDLIIPRGSNDLVKFIKANTSIPVMGHADGVCHVYVDVSADISKAISICEDSKTEYPAVCNSCETILVHEAMVESFLPDLAFRLAQKGVTFHCDPRSFQQLSNLEIPGLKVERLYEHLDEQNAMKVFKKEYLTLDVSIVVVSNLDSAIAHINKFGSHHTDCIVAENSSSVEKFSKQVDSAGVFSNCSTRFADGFRYGFGAEVGVSTNKLHARGPVGMEGLLSYKYKLVGSGHIVAPYNTKQKKFTHKNLDLNSN